MTTESRANRLRAYGEMLINSNDVEQEEIGENLIEFAEQWEAELTVAKQKVKNLIYPTTMTDEMADAVLKEIFGE